MLHADLDNYWSSSILNLPVSSKSKMLWAAFSLVNFISIPRRFYCKPILVLSNVLPSQGSLFH